MFNNNTRQQYIQLTLVIFICRLVNNLEMNCFTYKNYGKSFIKSQKLSPDSYIQMAQQYAFYR